MLNNSLDVGWLRSKYKGRGVNGFYVLHFFLFHLEWPFFETQKGTAQWSPSEEEALPYLAGFFSLARRLFFPHLLWKSWSSSSGPKRKFWQPLILQKGRNLQDKKQFNFSKIQCFMSLLLRLVLPDFANIYLIVNNFYICGFTGLEWHWQRSTGQKSTRRIQEIVQVCVFEITITTFLQPDLTLIFHYFVFNCHSEGLSTINQQSSELAKAFMFWPSPDVREGPNVYDIRFADILHIFLFQIWYVVINVEFQALYIGCLFYSQEMPIISFYIW